MTIQEVNERAFSGTLRGILDDGAFDVTTPLAGVILPDRMIHASTGTGGIVMVQVKHGEKGDLYVFGSSNSTLPPTEQFPFLPIASILELKITE